MASVYYCNGDISLCIWIICKSTQIVLELIFIFSQCQTFKSQTSNLLYRFIFLSFSSNLSFFKISIFLTLKWFKAKSRLEEHLSVGEINSVFTRGVRHETIEFSLSQEQNWRGRGGALTRVQDTWVLEVAVLLMGCDWWPRKRPVL